MKSNFDTYNCQCKDNTCTSSGTVACDKPKGYDTGTEAALNVYLSDETTKTKGASVSYTNSGSGVIYNMIPGQVYYWELASDSNVYGLVKASDDGNRRILNTEGVGNTRDLGGLRVDADGDGTADGTLKYGIIFRGEKIGTSSAGKIILQNLGINEDVAGFLATKNERFAYDSYRRFIQMFSDVVMEVDKSLFEKEIDKMKEEKGVKLDTELTAAD